MRRAKFRIARRDAHGKHNIVFIAVYAQGAESWNSQPELLQISGTNRAIMISHCFYFHIGRSRIVLHFYYLSYCIVIILNLFSSFRIQTINFYESNYPRSGGSEHPRLRIFCILLSGEPNIRGSDCSLYCDLKKKICRRFADRSIVIVWRLPN